LLQICGITIFGNFFRKYRNRNQLWI